MRIPFNPTHRLLRPALQLLMLALALPAICVLASADEQFVHMARVSLTEGQVSYRRANDAGSDWYDASVNMPLGENDQVFTSPGGRAEVQLTGRNIVRLDYDTSFKITQFNTNLTQVALAVGTATFRIDSLDPRQFQVVDARDWNDNDPLYFEVSTPTAAITLRKTGIYRISVRDDGTTEVQVRQGEADVYNKELGSLIVKQGRAIWIEGKDPGDYRLAKLNAKDDWDRWNDRRDDELADRREAASPRYVPTAVPGVYDLDRYGDWYHTPEYGYVWSPRLAGVNWAPYRAGYWQWYPGFGWTWISTEPWGWAPYHYGRWAYFRSRWCWVPRGSFSAGFSWSPALVAFFGFGGGSNPGYNSGYRDGYRQGYRNGAYNYVGWIPLAPGERHYHSTLMVNNTTINNTTIYHNAPGQINNYRNYGAPGGLTGIEGRRFDSPRVVVSHVAPAPVINQAAQSAVTLRGDLVRPVQTLQPHTPPPSLRPQVTQAANANLVTRGLAPNRLPNGSGQPSNAVRAIEGGIPTMRGEGSTRRVERVHPPAGEPTNAPANLAPTQSNADRPAGAVTVETPAQQPGIRRVERPSERRVEGSTTNSQILPGHINTGESERRVERPDRSRSRHSESDAARETPRRVESVERQQRVESRPRNEAQPVQPREDRRPEQHSEPRAERPQRSERQEAPRRVEQPSPRQPERSAPRQERSEPTRSEPSRNVGPGRRGN